jgi:hypothetical protein
LIKIPFWEGTVSKIYGCVWKTEPQHMEASPVAVAIEISVAPASGIVNRIFYQFLSNLLNLQIF